MTITQNPSIIGRIKQIEGENAVVEYTNGNLVVYKISENSDLQIGDIILITQNNDRFKIIKASNLFWQEYINVGVVKLKLDHCSIIETGGGQWIEVPTNEKVKYSEGYTVKFSLSNGVVEVLSRDPIKRLELPTIDEQVIKRFKTEKDLITETFDEFGGYKKVVDRAKELITNSLNERDILFKIGVCPIKGVLFTGLPGTGKTMLARIIAKITNADFYNISGPEIFSKWYGQSEKILRVLFEDAAKQDQAIIFFDEIDSVAGHRSKESHEASHRVVGQLLSLMDGFEKGDNVIVIAATNRPEDIDVALRRPGRFDWEIKFPLPNEMDRKDILEKSSKKLTTSVRLDHTLISQTTEGWSAADLVAIWKEAAFLAIADGRDVIMNEDYIGGYERVKNNKK